MTTSTRATARTFSRIWTTRISRGSSITCATRPGRACRP
jgi:hypothetical protein